MKVKVYKCIETDKAMLVDWRYLEPLWLRSKCAQIDKGKLIDAYCERWIDISSQPWGFILGEVCINRDANGQLRLDFSNGRHRTNLMAKHQSRIPVCILGDIPDDAEIKNAFVMSLEAGDVVDIPDLPISYTI